MLIITGWMKSTPVIELVKISCFQSMQDRKDSKAHEQHKKLEDLEELELKHVLEKCAKQNYFDHHQLHL